MRGATCEPRNKADVCTLVKRFILLQIFSVKQFENMKIRNAIFQIDLLKGRSRDALMVRSQKETVGIASIGHYIPENILTSSEISMLSGIPLPVFLEKIGMEKKHIAARMSSPQIWAFVRPGRRLKGLGSILVK